ncbi:phage tail assembly chaperone [Edaphosphingomonas haloaromaticamans]|uniref:Phage tail assembly chaperone n=1 Tax=Edaphosphingomonas haloaromaticamans TaxID=653954 RepID=A0A1S1HCP2_9SPHN|nr:hypothetical protein BHE75_01898 [Sphingomonas haloaromaticamans]
MGLALAAFGWSADQFWRSTHHEFVAMCEARQQMNKRPD